MKLIKPQIHIEFEGIVTFDIYIKECPLTFTIS